MTTAPVAMAVLRAATADRHQRLEDALDLLADDLTLDRWRRTLVRLLGVVEPLERALDRTPPPVDDWPARRRAALLRADAGDPDVVPPCAALPDVSTPGRAMGALYVLEGSTLGGRHVSAHVRRVLGAAAGVRWFTAYGDAAPARWASFRAAAGRHDPEEMAAAAQATFDAFLARATA